MDQSSYWMWTKGKNRVINSHVVSPANPSYGNSWEEQAFAEDAAGPLGGCVWPPRSYTCSFCRREFRSAQALGGHMNVHRRDRARLKQCPTPNNDILQNSQISTLGHNPNPDSGQGFLVSSPSLCRVSAPLREFNCDEKKFVPPFTTPSIVHEDHKRTMAADQYDQYYNITDFKKEEIKNSKILESNFKVKGCDLSVSLNLVVCRREGKDDEVASQKRQRTDATVSFFSSPRSVHRDHRCRSDFSENINFTSEIGSGSGSRLDATNLKDVVKLCPNSVDDIDLELKLGY